MSNVLKDKNNGVESTPILARHHKKWQRAFTALFSSRAFSQARKIVAKNQDKILNKFSPSSSYSVIDIEAGWPPRIDQLKLSKLVREKNTKHLTEFGGVQGLVTALDSHADLGIQADTENIDRRRQAFGSNMIQKPSLKVLQIALETFKDPIIVVLLVCASLSLGFGVKKNGLEGVTDGLSIISSILAVVSVTSYCNIWITRQFHMISIDVMRKGCKQKIPIFEIVVGDVVFLQTGDQVPADGLCLHGHSLQVNESKLLNDANFAHITVGNNNPFLLSGSKVIEGNAQMLVTAVGMNTKWGKVVNSTCFINDKTPLQVKLHKLTRIIAKVGLLVASLVLIVLLIRYFTGYLYDNSGKVDFKSGKTSNVCKTIIGILVTPIVIATTAIPDALILAVTVSIAYSTKRMATDPGVMRNISSCEAIGRITVICTDKNGSLPNTSKAVLECQNAGVNVKMLTATDVYTTAKASAIECGILNPNQTTTKEDIIEGTEFQNYTDQERLEKVDTLSVLANASTSDKLIMVQCLKQRGHVIGITQGCLPDEIVIGITQGCLPDEIVLQKAGVCLSLWTQITQGMKEKDIIFLDGNLNSIPRTLRWGRGIYNNIQMYTQFHLTATISSLVIDSVSTIFAREPPTINIVTVITAGKVPFAAVQVLWVKLIVGTLVAVALTADDPAENLMQQALADPIEPFITNIMWRNIIGQALYQIIILVTIQFKGETTFNLNAREKDTLIFNIFVLCQIFTIFNSVKGKNIFEGLKGKKRFWIIIGIILALQVVIVELLKRIAGTERLSWKQWRASIGITILSSLVGWCLKRIPVPKEPFSLALNSSQK